MWNVRQCTHQNFHNDIINICHWQLRESNSWDFRPCWKRVSISVYGSGLGQSSLGILEYSSIQPRRVVSLDPRYWSKFWFNARTRLDPRSKRDVTLDYYWILWRDPPWYWFLSTQTEKSSMLARIISRIEDLKLGDQYRSWPLILPQTFCILDSEICSRHSSKARTANFLAQ